MIEVIMPRRNRRRVSMPFRYTYTPEAASWAHAPAPSVFTGDPAGDWELRIYGAGTLTVQSPKAVDIFALGAGGRASDLEMELITDPTARLVSLAGGGSGYTETAAARLVPGHEYRVDVGDRGSIQYAYTAVKDVTTDTYLVHVTRGSNGSANYDISAGGNGGSGGAATYAAGGSASNLSASGGLDGADGGQNPAGDSRGGTGQGTTTRAFGESTGELFASGGDAAYLQSVARQPSTWGDGGAVEYVNGSAVRYDPWPGLIIIRNARG